MTDKERKTDLLLRRALGDMEAPDEALLRQVKASLEKEQDMKTSNMTKRVLTIALAAALLLALSVTAYAYLDAGEWFKSWFGAQTQNELTTGQLEHIESITAGIGQGVTQDGWTVTVESTIADWSQTYITVSIRAPEGVDLNAGMLYIPNRSLVSTDPAMASYDIFAAGGSAGAVDDGDGSDNTVAMVFTHEASVGLADCSYPWVLTLEDIRMVEFSQDGEKETVLAEGPWCVEFMIPPPDTEPLELISEPLVCEGWRSVMTKDGVVLDSLDGLTEREEGTIFDDWAQLGVRWEEEYVPITLVSFRLSPLGVAWEYEYTADGEVPSLGMAGDVLVVMKDGSTVEAIDGAGGPAGKKTLAAPIILDEVAYIQLPRGYSIPMPD